MRTGLRVAIFAGAVVAVFALAFAGVRAITGDASESAPAARARHAHESGSHGSDPHGHESTGTDEHAGHSESAEAAEVRGLGVEQDGYRIGAVAAPSRPGAAGTLAFSLTGPDGAPLTDYTTTHERDLHLVVVRTDGTQFRHVHPQHRGEGRWSLPWRWATAGAYRVFADFVPTALGEPVTLTSTVEVPGSLTPAIAAPTDTAEVAGYTVRRTGDLGAEPSAQQFMISRAGEPVTDLEPYLGAHGHLVALRAGDLGYLHVHPEGDHGAGTAGPMISFSASAPTPGRYLLYLDFKVDGQVHTAAFTAQAAG